MGWINIHLLLISQRHLLLLRWLWCLVLTIATVLLLLLSHQAMHITSLARPLDGDLEISTIFKKSLIECEQHVLGKLLEVCLAPEIRVSGGSILEYRYRLA